MSAPRLLTRAQSAAAAIDATLSTGAAVILTLPMLEALICELGTAELVLRTLNAAVELRQRPLVINTGAKTVILKPDSWTPERAMGWIGGIHDDLESEFGPMSRVRRSR